MLGLQPIHENGMVLGLIFRRRKWRVAEHNRILASWDSIPESRRRDALDGLLQHKAAVVELEALIAGAEPVWGNERGITEQFLSWEPSINGGSQTVKA